MCSVVCLMSACSLPESNPTQQVGEVHEPTVVRNTQSNQKEKGVSMSNFNVTMSTSKGDIHFTLFPEQAPVTVASFTNLVQRGYYDGLSFHRVISDFMVQGGCPEGTGTGGPGYQFECEADNGLHHDAPGKLSMANAGANTNGSQFFVTHVPTDWLDGKHTVFGEVVGEEDQAVVDAIEGGDTITQVTIEGDTAALLESLADRVTEWNSVLD